MFIQSIHMDIGKNLRLVRTRRFKRTKKLNSKEFTYGKSKKRVIVKNRPKFLSFISP